MPFDLQKIGLQYPFFLIAGPCLIESEELVFEIATQMIAMTQRLGIPYVFKASFDKANRTSNKSFRGIGMEKGLQILQKVSHQLQVPVITDVHDAEQAKVAAQYVDILQTPAFLCRQTDFIEAVCSLGKPVNIKKGQFLAPSDMLQVIAKAKQASMAAGFPNTPFFACERGASFGYQNLVSDMRSLVIMRNTGCPVVFDATHSVQLPGGKGSSSGGQREFVPVLARAAVASGVAGIFMETHPRPEQALSDGANAWPLHLMSELLQVLVAIDKVVKQQRFVEQDLMESL